MCSLFEQLALKGVDRLKENILKRLHNHSFTNILSDLPSNSHQMCLKSCVGLGVRTWLLTHLIILFFQLSSNVFSTTLRTRLGFSHLLILGVSHCICS